MTTTTHTKYINIDTRLLHNEPCVFSEYFIRLYEKIKNVKSLSIASIELPISYYNISCLKNNNYFNVTKINSQFGEQGREHIIVLPDDNYTIQSIVSTLQIIFKNNDELKDLEVSVTPTNTIQFYSRTSEFDIDFIVNKVGFTEEFCVKTKLGWILGFRNPSYSIRMNSGIIAETTCDLSFPRYVYLSLEFHCEDNKGHHYAFDSSLFHSCLDKNIIARITIDNNGYPYGSILPANLVNGFLISDIRKFHHSIDIKKIKIKIIDEFGFLMNLNGFDVSFLISYETLH